jgi:subtilisin family serine protease
MRTRLVTISGTVLLLVLLGARSAVPGELDPALVGALQQAGRGEKVPVLIVMADQGLSASELAHIRNLSHRKKRAAGRATLQHKAALSQAGVRAYLQDMAERGQAAEVRPLWMVNAIAAQLPVARVYEVAALAGVDRVLWDPAIPAEKLLDDDGGSGTPARPVAPPTPRPRSESMRTQIYWQLTAVKAPQAWSLGYNGQEVLVAVIDTGVDYNHTDLRTHIFTNPGEIPGNGIDDDQNGFIDDVHGWDFVWNDNDPMGDNVNDHGTKVAGIVAGDGTGGINTGVAPKAKILPLKAVGGPLSGIFAAIDYAVAMNTDVIQMSVTQKWSDNPKPDFAAWRAVTDNELALGIFHSNSISNNGTHQDTDPIPFNVGVPGNCPSPWLHGDQFLVGGASGVISAGAISDQYIAADYSSRGPVDWEDIALHFPAYPYTMPLQYQDYPYSGGDGGLTKPDLCAPGPGTLSTQLGGGYSEFSGTSAASPHIAGAMAILLQANPELTPAQVDMILETTAVDLGEPGKDVIYGAGCLDVNAALLKVLALSEYATVSGAVTTDDGSLVPRAQVLIQDPAIQEQTNQLAGYRFSVPGGQDHMTVSAFGYLPDTSWVTAPAGTVTAHDVKLTPRPVSTLSGVVRDTQGGMISGVRVSLPGTPLPSDTTGPDGRYRIESIPAGIPLTVEAVLFGYHTTTSSFVGTGADTLDLVLAPGLFDDFESDQGWKRDPMDTANMGRWERCAPVGTWSGTVPVQPDSDADAGGTLCYVTQNANPGAGPDFADVDGGSTTLISPIFDGSGYTRPFLSYRLWYSNNANGAPDDMFRTDGSSDGGSSWVNLETILTSSPAWVLHTVDLASRLTITSAMRVRFIASDTGTPSTVEAGVDDVMLLSDQSGVAQGQPAWRLRLAECFPNPFVVSAVLAFEIPGSARTSLSLYNVQGRLVRSLFAGSLPPGPHRVIWDGRDDSGRRCPSGVYLSRLAQAGAVAERRVVLIR